MTLIVLIKYWALVLGAVGIAVSLAAMILDMDPLDALACCVNYVGKVISALLICAAGVVLVAVSVIVFIFMLPALLFAFLGSIIYQACDVHDVRGKM